MIAILAKNRKFYVQHIEENSLLAKNCFFANSFESLRRHEITEVRVDASAKADDNQLGILKLAQARKV